MLTNEQDPHARRYQTVVEEIGEEKHLIDDAVLLEVAGEVDRRLKSEEAEVQVGEKGVKGSSIEQQLRQPDALGEVENVDRLNVAKTEKLYDQFLGRISKSNEQQHQWSEEKEH